MYIENKTGINQIVYNPKAKNFCPIGQDWYTSDVVVVMTPDKVIPDYIELDNFIQEEINGKELIIEEVVAKIYKHIDEKYQPEYLAVTNRVTDASHSSVEVSIG